MSGKSRTKKERKNTPIAMHQQRAKSLLYPEKGDMRMVRLSQNAMSVMIKPSQWTTHDPHPHIKGKVSV